MNIKKLNEFKKNSGLTNAQIAEITGITQSNIDKITSGNNKNPKFDTIQAICKAIGCTVDDLDDTSIHIKQNHSQISTIEWQHIKKYRELDSHGKKMVDFTLNEEYERCISAKQEQGKPEEPKIEIRHSYYKVSAGTGFNLDNDENWEMIYVPDTPEARKADFALTIKGDSMEPIYYDGDIVYIVIASEVPIGKIGLFTQNGKGYIKEAGESYLISHNPDFPNIYPSDGKIECVGRVIGVAELPD